MASMDDLIATISSAGVGQESADLKELHSALASTLQRGPSYRPIKPNASDGPHDTGAVPPAPASSWNDSAPLAPPTQATHRFASGLGNSPRQTMPVPAPGANTSKSASATPNAVAFTGRRETGFSPERERERPHHSVLPANASPAEAVGFANDAFRPLWDKEPKSPWSGFQPTAKTA